MTEISLKVPQRLPGDEVGRKSTFDVAREHTFDFWQVPVGMERFCKMVPARGASKSNPGGECDAIEMEGKEILEVVKGEEKVRDAGSFGGVEIATVFFVAMVEIKVGPYLDGRSVSVCGPSSVIRAFEFRK